MPLAGPIGMQDLGIEEIVKQKLASDKKSKELALAKSKKDAALKKTNQAAAAKLGLPMDATSEQIKFEKMKQSEAAKATSAAERKLSEAQKLESRKAAARESASAATRSALGSSIVGQAQGLGLEKFGLGEGDLDKSRALRESIFQQQQAAFAGQAGTAQRQASEALQRRLAQTGIRGTGTAERLAQVQERELTGQIGEQAGQLRLGQSQQELAALEGERAAKGAAQQFISSSQQQAENIAASLISGGLSEADARSFATQQNRAAQDFQRNVLLPMQNTQWERSFNESVRQYQDTFDRDSKTIAFNMEMARKGLNQPGILQQLLGGSTTGALLGGVGGFMVGGPWGAAAGAAIGGRVGEQLGI